MSPAPRSSSAVEDIHDGFANATLANVLVATSDNGIVAILFGDRPARFRA